MMRQEQTPEPSNAPSHAQGNENGVENGSAPKAPDDRSTTFQPVEGGTETRSGTTLVVEAYVVIWTILMVWLLLLWRKQNTLNRRLDDLERAIDRAAKSSG